MSAQATPSRVNVNGEGSKQSALEVRARICWPPKISGQKSGSCKCTGVFGCVLMGLFFHQRHTSALLPRREFSARVGFALRICFWSQYATTLLFGMGMAGGSVAGGLTRARQLSIWQSRDSCLKEFNGQFHMSQSDRLLRTSENLPLSPYSVDCLLHHHRRAAYSKAAAGSISCYTLPSLIFQSYKNIQANPSAAHPESSKRKIFQSRFASPSGREKGICFRGKL